MAKTNDYTGLKRFRLEAVKFTETINNQRFWLFKCDCGNEKLIRASDVFSNKRKYPVKSCGCFKKESGSQKIISTKERLLTTVYGNYRSLARNRGYKFNLSKYKF